MGSNGSRTIDIKNINDHFNMCQLLEIRNCPIYGQLKCVRYKEMNFNIAQSMTGETPHPMSIHYLVLPNYILFPDFTLLQQISPTSLSDLLSIMRGVSQMLVEGGIVGVGANRIAYKDRWGVVGQIQTGWAYQQVYQHSNTDGVYFSPQMMVALSQNRQQPRFDPQKSDVFALGLMLVQIIFGQSISDIYDYKNFQIRLNSLLQKLTRIREQFGEQVAQIFIGMLQIEEQDRFDFEQLLSAINQAFSPPQSRYMLNSNNSNRNLQHSRNNRTPNKISQNNKTPKNLDRGQYRNDVSPFRQRFGGATNKQKTQPQQQFQLPRKTPQRAQGSRSPMRRQVGVSPLSRR